MILSNLLSNIFFQCQSCNKFSFIFSSISFSIILSSVCPSKFLHCFFYGIHHIYQTTTYFVFFLLIFKCLYNCATFLLLEQIMCCKCQKNTVETWFLHFVLRLIVYHQDYHDIDLHPKYYVFARTLFFRDFTLSSYYYHIVLSKKF